MSVDDRGENHWNKFMVVGLVKLDEITNMVIENKLPPKHAVFFYWLASYAWITEKGMRHKVTFPVSKLAFMFNVSVPTMRTWLRKLEELNLIRKLYLVRNIKNQ